MTVVLTSSHCASACSSLLTACRRARCSLPAQHLRPPPTCPCHTHAKPVSLPPASQVLAAHRILSAPVVVGAGGACGDSSSSAGPAGDRAPEVAGFIDIRDLLSSFLHGGPAGSLQRQRGRCRGVRGDAGRLGLSCGAVQRQALGHCTCSPRRPRTSPTRRQWQVQPRLGIAAAPCRRPPLT